MTANQFIVGIAAVTALAWGVLLCVAAMQSDRFRHQLLCATAALSITLLRLPVLVGNGSAAKLVALAPLIVAIPLAGGWRRKLDHRIAWLLGLYAAGVLLEVVRGSRAGAYLGLTEAVATGLGFVVIAWFAVALFATAKDHELPARMVGAALAPAVYALANLLLWASPVTTGFEDLSVAANTPATLAKSLGVAMNRVSFPLAISINGFGVVCAVGFATAVVLALRSRTVSRMVTVPLAGACLMCMVMTDSRGPLLYALGVTLFFALFRRIRGAHGIAVLLPLSPVIVTVALGYFASTDATTILSRGGSGSFVTGTGRTEIWAAVEDVLRRPQPVHLVGFGAGGQITSGASRRYDLGKDGEDLPAHNAYLQQILDGGYVGLAVLLALFALTAAALGRAARLIPAYSALLAGLLTLMVCGFTEVTPSYYLPETVMLFALAAGAAVASGLRPRPRSTTPDRRTGSQYDPLQMNDARRDHLPINDEYPVAHDASSVR